jgi:hypothetical protein
MKIKRAIFWPVFEKKTFRGGINDRSIEPREAVIGDVDGDERNDITLLVHNRVLVYRQDTGEVKPDSAKSINGANGASDKSNSSDPKTSNGSNR